MISFLFVPCSGKSDSCHQSINKAFLVSHLYNLNDPFSISNNLLIAIVPCHLSIRGLCADFKLDGVLLHAVDRLQLGCEGVRVWVNLQRWVTRIEVLLLAQ